MFRTVYKALLFSKLLSWFCKFSNFIYLFSNRIYINLALVFAVLLSVDLLLGGLLGGSENSTYDLIMKYRFNSPSASDQIVIIDVDEKSLSVLAKDYGRWPWSRSVFAEVLSTLESEEPRSIILNILTTDPDIKDQDGDQMLQSVVDELKVTTFPFVRLNPQNDSLSQLKLSSLNDADFVEDQSIALLLPFLKNMHSNMGISNLLHDDDGVIRHYPFLFHDQKFSYPSLVNKATKPYLQDSVPDEYLLNWRNKKGNYERISFADYFQFLQGKNDNFKYSFKDKFIIIGSSAPGIASLKLTPLGSTTDDNEIIATAIDDAINKSYLRACPTFINLLIGYFVIFLIGLLFVKNSEEINEDIVFGFLEIAVVAIMFLFVNYSTIYVDFSGAVKWGLVFFTIAKIISILGNRSIYGAKEHLSVIYNKNIKSYALIPFVNNKISKENKSLFLKEIINKYGVENVFLSENSFVENKVSDILNDYACITIFDSSSTKTMKLDLKKILVNFKDFKIVEIRNMQKVSNLDKFKKILNIDILKALIRLN